MKFCKKYQEYMQGQQKQLPAVDFKKLKKILKKCRKDFESHQDHDGQSCPHHCPLCDGTFFPSLVKEMSAVVGCFNKRAQKLLELHLASGFRKYFMLQKDHAALIQEGKDLVTYALINAIAVRKILKKYDKIHYSKQGQAFKSKAQSMHIEILQSPWLCELMAFHINLRETKVKSSKAPALFEGCSLTFDDDKPSLSCELFDSIKLDIDLTCSICLLFFHDLLFISAYAVLRMRACIELQSYRYKSVKRDTVFDPVSLTCGHIFCYMCACSAASVTIVDGLKAAKPKEKCPLCRKTGVYEGALHLEELNILLSRSFHKYWEQRLQTERIERIRQVKEHWESQCRAFMGV
ncbi:E3 ubiquitin-protein ligase BAH1-like 1 isoform X1 [Populus alba x Populus x berolinensis]|uniref:RING-type E3 ubiquitin transferase n=1 Tax=Populus alba x Populus x berolinensis TaxID=444605 RepID=A0AAD6LTJ1_9ROSI|nr:E3 ubiquitin-protein ligase BAH1-like 1 isoform X1 [Populus alba x Populus x berolinensis]